jgi:hypothetical protein
MKRKTMRAIFKTMTRVLKVRRGNLGIYEMIQTFLAWKKIILIILMIGVAANYFDI